MFKSTCLLTLIILFSTVITLPAQTIQKIAGTPFGAPAYSYTTETISNTENTPAKAFDGDFSTFYASYYKQYAWVGLKLNKRYVITKVGFAPREEWESRMYLGVLEGANKADFSDGIPLGIIKETPTAGKMSYIDIDCSKGVRYVRFVHTPKGSGYSLDTVRCNVAELEFYGYADSGDESNLFRLTNIPTVIIHTENSKRIADKNNWINGTISVISYDNDGGTTTIFSDSLQIKGRGNASWGFAKKPYKFKLSHKAKLPGMHANAKKWTLVNNCGDKTLMRNMIAFDFSRSLGMRWTPDAQPVDLIINGEYCGNYQLCDQIEVHHDRVAVEEMSTSDISGENLNGGYLIEIDGYASSEGTQNLTWFKSTKETPVTIKHPSDDKIKWSQANYIRSVFNNMESLVMSESDDGEDFTDYLDIDSFLKHFIVGELSGNTDTYWSTYMYKYRTNDKLFTGPVWDFDLGFNNDSRTYPVHTKKGYLYLNGGSNVVNMRNLVWRILKNEKVNARLQYLWSYARKHSFNEESILATIDDYAEELDESQSLNFKKWDYLNKKIHMNPKIYGSYEKEVKAVKDYISGRLQTLDDIIGLVDIPDDPEPDDASEIIFGTTGAIYMYGFSNETQYIISDLMGRAAAKGTIESEITRVPLQPGLYIVYLKHDKTKTRVKVCVE